MKEKEVQLLEVLNDKRIKMWIMMKIDKLEFGRSYITTKMAERKILLPLLDIV